MLRWIHLTAGILSIIILSSLLIIFLRRWCCLRKPDLTTTLNATSPIRNDTFQERLSKLHQTSLIHQLDTSDIKRRGNIINYPISRTLPSKPGLFIWTDHPSLVAEAVENGWTRFGFVVHTPPPMVNGASPGSVLLSLCTTGVSDPGVVITWEVSNGSVDFTQTIKFNQEMVNGQNHLMVVRAALPLPGPQLISCAFPQEAYFEITILEISHGEGCGGYGGCEVVEGEKTKLFKSQGVRLVKRSEWDGGNEEAVLSLGLATGGSFGAGQIQLPGRFPGSIGFQSDGAVYLDGMKLVCESAKHEWAKENKVIGCGYDPRKKKVYFTVNSHLVHVINCKADEFGTPLYPILASNTEAKVLVNLGQSPFYYIPANAHRTPNPACAGTLAGLEDSKELFSIGRIDSHYMNSFFMNKGNCEEITSGRANVENGLRRKLDYDEESDDADLFEIALERSGKPSPAKL